MKGLLSRTALACLVHVAGVSIATAAPTGPMISISPHAIDFGVVLTNPPPILHGSFSISSTGDEPLVIQGIGVSTNNLPVQPATLTQTNDCGASLAPGATCTVQFSVDLSTGPLYPIFVASNGSATPETITLQLTPALAQDDADGDGIPNGVESIEGRNPAVKDNDVFGNARLFAMQQYRDFLGREGDPGGIQFWTSQVDAGAPRASMIESFFSSAEFQGTTAPVARLYFAYFLRVPDYGGISFWTGYYRAGNSLESISNSFASSSEFASRYGSLDDAAFVGLVYQNVLGRAPDPSGAAFWLSQLNAGMSRGNMMVQFSESPEYRGLISNEIFVTMAYTGMLRRAPEPDGFAFWVDYLDGGRSGIELLRGFLSSVEYRQRFLP